MNHRERRSFMIAPRRTFAGRNSEEQNLMWSVKRISLLDDFGMMSTSSSKKHSDSGFGPCNSSDGIVRWAASQISLLGQCAIPKKCSGFSELCRSMLPIAPVHWVWSFRVALFPRSAKFLYVCLLNGPAVHHSDHLKNLGRCLPIYAFLESAKIKGD